MMRGIEEINVNSARALELCLEAARSARDGIVERGQLTTNGRAP